MLFMPVKVAAAIELVMQVDDDLEALMRDAAAAAAFLLPIAVETNWPCRVDLIAWLTVVRDSCSSKSSVDLH